MQIDIFSLIINPWKIYIMLNSYIYRKDRINKPKDSFLARFSRSLLVQIIVTIPLAFTSYLFLMSVCMMLGVVLDGAFNLNVMELHVFAIDSISFTALSVWFLIIVITLVKDRKISAVRRGLIIPAELSYQTWNALFGFSVKPFAVFTVRKIARIFSGRIITDLFKYPKRFLFFFLCASVIVIFLLWGLFAPKTTLGWGNQFAVGTRAVGGFGFSGILVITVICVILFLFIMFLGATFILQSIMLAYPFALGAVILSQLGMGTSNFLFSTLSYRPEIYQRYLDDPLAVSEFQAIWIELTWFIFMDIGLTYFQITPAGAAITGAFFCLIPLFINDLGRSTLDNILLDRDVMESVIKENRSAEAVRFSARLAIPVCIILIMLYSIYQYPNQTGIAYNSEGGVFMCLTIIVFSSLAISLAVKLYKEDKRQREEFWKRVTDFSMRNGGSFESYRSNLQIRKLNREKDRKGNGRNWYPQINISLMHLAASPTVGSDGLIKTLKFVDDELDGLVEISKYLKSSRIATHLFR